MSNFILEFKKGQEGKSRGIPLTEGMSGLGQHIGGIHKARIYGFAAASKVGKSTAVDNILIQCYLYCALVGLELEIIYYSYEIDRISKEFEFAAHFLNRDYSIYTIPLPPGQTYRGEPTVDLCSDYLRGRLIADDNTVIKVTEEVKSLLIQVYTNRIEPIFGEYSDEGVLLSTPVINFISQKENPTGMYKYLQAHAEKNGKVKKNSKSKKIVSYTPNNPEKYTLVVTDHLRKIPSERGFSKKENVDKFSEYAIEIKNDYGYTFLHIIHINRNLADHNRLKMFSDMLYPTSDDIKDTGNLSEDVDYLITMFNPNDEKYGLKDHFGARIKTGEGQPLYPFMRTFHLVENRHGSFPEHFRVNMNGGIKSFQKLNI